MQCREDSLATIVKSVTKYISFSFRRLHKIKLSSFLKLFLSFFLVWIYLAFYIGRRGGVIWIPCITFFLTEIVKESSVGFFDVIIKWNNHPEEEVFCENFQEEERYSEVKHLYQYWYHSWRYISCPYIICGYCLQLCYDLHDIFWFL